MKIWLVSLFEPTPMDSPAMARFIGISEAAIKQGHEVEHFTSTFRHVGKSHRFENDQVVEIQPDYKIHYIHSLGYNKNIEAKRFYAHYDFAKRLIKYFDKLEKPDLIFISMPPISVAYHISKWAGKNGGIPYVVDIIDPWPDSFIKDVPNRLKSVGNILITPFRKKLTEALSNAHAVTGISKQYVNWALSHLDEGSSKKHYHFYPAVDLAGVRTQLDLQKDLRDNDKITMIYAGSLASSYDIPCILKAAEQLESECPGKTLFLIAGTGPQEELIKNYMKSYSNVEYLGWLKRAELMNAYKRSDLGLIQHKNSLTQTVTYKLFSYLSADLPVLNSLQSEMVDIINDNEVGFNNSEGDFAKLSSNIKYYLDNPDKLNEHKRNALELTESKGDTKKVYKDLVEFITSPLKQEVSAEK